MRRGHEAGRADDGGGGVVCLRVGLSTRAHDGIRKHGVVMVSGA